MKAIQVLHQGVLALAAALFTLGLATVCLADNPGPNPGVLPPNANAQGHGYGGWSAEWFKWFLSIPTSMHPALDSTGDFCAEGQSGKVFYLTANFVTTDTVPCTVPAGTSILFAMANAECSTVEPPPFFGSTEEELRECAKCWADHIVPSSLEAMVDGRPLQELASYRAASPLYSFEYPADNILGNPDGPGTGQSVADGYWIYLSPLPVGDHTVSFSGVLNLPAGDDCGSGLGPTSLGFSGSYELTAEGGGGD